MRATPSNVEQKRGEIFGVSFSSREKEQKTYAILRIRVLLSKLQKTTNQVSIAVKANTAAEGTSQWHMAAGFDYNRTTTTGAPDPPDVCWQQQRDATWGVVQASSSTDTHDLCHPNLSATIAVEIGRLNEEQASESIHCYKGTNLVSISWCLVGLGYFEATSTSTILGYHRTL